MNTHEARGPPVDAVGLSYNALGDTVYLDLSKDCRVEIAFQVACPTPMRGLGSFWHYVEREVEAGRTPQVARRFSMADFELMEQRHYY